MRAAIYDRSAGGMTRPRSVLSQIHQLIALATRRGLSVEAVFTDVSSSGFDLSHHGLGALLNAARNPYRSWSAVLVWDLKRFSRSRAALSEALDVLRRHGCSAYLSDLGLHDVLKDPLLGLFVSSKHDLTSRRYGPTRGSSRK